MARIIKDDMFDEILASGPKQNFYQKEEVGSVSITFTTPVSITEPGEEDILGRIWNPPVIDANGNPIIDPRTGNQREPWAKVEAECVIDKIPRVYSFGGKSSPLLRAWTSALKMNDVTNATLPGTKWQASKIGKWNWKIEYLGREDIPSKSNGDEKIKDLKVILSDLKSKNPMVSKGVDKKQLIKTVALLSGKSQSDVEDVWSLLIQNKCIEEKDGKSFVL